MLDIDLEKDFECTMTVKSLKQGTYAGIKLKDFEYKATDDLAFLIACSKTKQFYHQQVVNGRTVKKKGWRLSNHVNGNKEETNRLKLRKIGSYLYLYVNDSLVDSHSNLALSQLTTFSCYVAQGGYAAFDGVEVKYLSGEETKARNRNIYTTDFRDSNLWGKEIMGTCKSYYENGAYYMDMTNCMTSAHRGVNLNIDKSRDYEMNLKITFVSQSGSDVFCGLMFGADSEGNYCSLSTSYTRDVAVFSYEGKKVKIQTPEQVTHVPMEIDQIYLSLRVVKIGSRMDYYVDNQFMFSTKVLGFGSGVGLFRSIRG